MNKPKFFIFALLLLLAAVAAAAQTDEKKQIDASYEIVLHVVVASNSGNEKSDIPSALSGVIGRLKKDYTYKNYNLAATFLERISVNGVVGHTGVLNQLDQARLNRVYYSDWELSGLRSGKDEKGVDSIQFQGFNFGAKVPVVVAVNAKGDGEQVINYQNIGLRINRFNLPENVPTIVGSLATPKTEEFIFLVLTVRPV